MDNGSAYEPAQGLPWRNHLPIIHFLWSVQICFAFAQQKAARFFAAVFGVGLETG